MQTLDEEYADAYVEYLDASAETDAEGRLLAALTLCDKTNALKARGLTDADIITIRRDFADFA